MIATVLNFLRPIREQLLSEIEQEQKLLDSAVNMAVACQHTKRRHAVETRHMNIARALSELDQLKQLRVCAAGAFFVDALQTLADEEQEVLELHTRLKKLELKTALLRTVCPERHNRTFEDLQDRLGKALEDQLLLEHRETCLDYLRCYLQDTDSEIGAEREALAEYFVAFLQAKLKQAVILAGDRNLPAWDRMLSSDLLHRAEEALARLEDKISEAVRQNRIPRNLHQLAWLETNRALSMLLVAHPQIVQKIALHLPDAAVGGTLLFLQQCLSALKQRPSSVDDDDVQYRMRVRYTSVGQGLNDYIERFANDLSRSEGQLEWCNGLLARALERLAWLETCQVY
ncbi:MAG TPA: hypothetical protein V6C97_33445 [Oculatellaceae cyanobacterium]